MVYKPFLEASDVWCLREGYNPAIEVYANSRNDGHELSIIEKLKEIAAKEVA
jgi:hypothetical protein